MNDEGLTAGEVARRLGIAVTTLRTWHQRYGLGPTRHTPGRHRRYTASDLTRIQEMRRLTGQGTPPAEAARIVLGQSRAPRAARAGGGRAIPVGRAGAPAQGLARAAIRLDAAAMAELITAAIRRDGVIHTWDRLIRPVLVGVGVRHAATGQLIDVEHLLSRSVSEALAVVPRPPGQSPRVLLACAEDEQHSLALEALAAALAEAGCASRLLGARVPPEALHDAVRRTGPVVAVIWSQLRETGDLRQLASLSERRPRPAVIMAAGPGWHDATPDGVERPRNLNDAYGRILRVAGVPA